MNISVKPCIVILLISLVYGCSATKEKSDSFAQAQEPSQSQLPQWILSPGIDDGFADTQCVVNNASMSILKPKATALARAELAKQISARVKAMDKTYGNLTETAAGSASGSSFESVSKQITEQQLNGSRATRLDYVDFPDGTNYLCVMVTLSPGSTQALYKEIVGQSGVKLSAQHDAILFQEFKAYKAQQELDRETSSD